MIVYWFYFSGCIKQDYKNKYIITGDWSQSRGRGKLEAEENKTSVRSYKAPLSEIIVNASNECPYYILTI